MIDDGDSSSSVGGKEVYNDKGEEPVLISLLELYPKLDIIFIGASSTLLVCLTLSTGYLHYSLLL